jgi:hypothetical protein
MANSVQTYKNHGRLLPAFHFFVLPVLLVNVINAIRHLWLMTAWTTAWGVVFAIGLLMLGLLSRAQAISVQDRVIRLEMRLRLQQLLPPDLQARIHELTPRQLIAMRFASDDEMTDLAREVLAGNLSTTKAIKMRVKNWQGDFMRA